jgi:ribosomal protein L37AE/L43A
MKWLNGRYESRDSGLNGTAAASVTAPAPAAAASAALTTSNTSNGTTTELARFMPVMDIEQAMQRREVIIQAMQRLMKDGVDYGKIPGTEKPTLLQPGADKLCNLFGLTLRYEFLEKEEDWSGERHGAEPFFYYQVAVKVFRGEFLLGEGVGACNSRESKYRWRKAERTCPVCGKANIRKSRDGGWYCWKKTKGCGSTFHDGDQSIEGQETGRTPNPDIADSVNTILKIAYKRAKISGTINATSAAEFFTQDREDFTVSDGIDTGGHPISTRAAAQYLAEQKIANGNPQGKAPWKNMGELAKAFQAIREKVGEVAWREELERYGWSSFQDLRNAIDNRTPNAKEKAMECYWHLDATVRGEVA